MVTWHVASETPEGHEEAATAAMAEAAGTLAGTATAKDCSTATVVFSFERESMIDEALTYAGNRDVISHQSSVISHQPSTISHQPAISHQPSAISHQRSAIRHQPSAKVEDT